jgi:hypothetical protein
MGKAIDSILASPPLRLSPGAAEAIASVEALARQQSQATQEAAQFEPVAPDIRGLACSFSWNPEALKLDLSASQAVTVDASKASGHFSITIRF